MTKPLFDYHTCAPLPTDTSSIVRTPLGTLGFEACVGDVSLNSLKRSSVLSTPADGQLFRWETERFQAELLLLPFVPELPEGMRVDGCWAGVWRVKAAEPAESVEFHCEWEPGYVWTQRGPDSGQWVDAQTWDDGNTQVNVGTQDGPALASTAAHGAFILPKRWSEILGEGWSAGTPDPMTGKINPVDYTQVGFRILLPELWAGELCQAHFVIAWGEAPPTPEAARTETLYASPWYAVDDYSRTEKLKLIL